MAKIKLKSLGTESAKLEKEVAVLAKRLKLTDNSGESIVPLELQKLVSAYILNLESRQEINAVLGVVAPEVTEENNPESSKIEISLKNGVNAEVEANIRAVLKLKGADSELAQKLTVAVIDVVKNAQEANQLSIGRLMRNKLSFTVNKVTHATPVK